ncbi:hypothetical protein [Thiothrix winogradskyi]|uniref:Uncharacterized protein n=1 Tax=Thiothrix winogradskyi TaxID=96472 RepID=A0ABY3T366_9GAMM|nr:hypothetical protein [Thiothrix winogradskyi]UJS26293.1 hypothetical protein L2Y54_09700 [Thiothrix winogradskyi]
MLLPDQNAALAHALERQLMENTRQRLTNWGRWWYANNQLIINRDTGKITQSPSGKLLDFAPIRTNTGYWQHHAAPINTDDALSLHHQITRLTPAEMREITRHYAEHAQGNTDAQRQTRRRAIRKLTGLFDII